MIDAHEDTFGPVPDRSIFDGEIVVPPHLRNMSATLGNRSSRLLGSLNRSRTFLTLPTRNSPMHGSTPDLSRSLPSTPNVIKQRITLADSMVPAVLEEDDRHTSPQQLIREAALTLRRKSDHDVSSKVQLRSGAKPPPTVYTTTPSLYRNQSDAPTTLPKRSSTSRNGATVLPFRVSIKKPIGNTANTTSNPMKSFFARKESPLISSSLHNIHTAPADADLADPVDAAAAVSSPSPASRSKWGNVRNSNSFSNDFNVGALSTKYTIPRPHLVPVALNGDALSDQQIILKALGAEDSAA